jgi:hypothetical protein
LTPTGVPVSPKSCEFRAEPNWSMSPSSVRTVRPRIDARYGRRCPLRLHKTDPNVRISHPFHDIIRKKSDGIFDGISGFPTTFSQRNQSQDPQDGRPVFPARQRASLLKWAYDKDIGQRNHSLVTY